uniref:Uncharacterized protein n=1 Tax=Romanomermis culicivorax TaxID=13658 RepID=A0A915HLZ6_ROMCU
IPNPIQQSTKIRDTRKRSQRLKPSRGTEGVSAALCPSGASHRYAPKPKISVMALVFDGGMENGDSNDIAQKNNTGDDRITDLKNSSVLIDAEIANVDRIREKFLSKYFTLNDLYRLSVRFYREKENKAFHVSYNDRTKLFAYTKVVKYGNFKELENSTKENNNNNNDVGFFNFIGSDLKLDLN